MRIFKCAAGFLKEELRLLTTIQSSDRIWQMPAAAALSTGIPLLVGAYVGRLDYGLASSLGGLAFLYLPATPLHHRMVTLMAAAFALTGCFALGLVGHLVPALKMPVLIFLAISATMLCRFYRIGMPGSLFFIMAASIAAYSSMPAADIPTMIGLISLGGLSACLIALFYSILTLRLRAPLPIEPLPKPTFDFVVFDSVVIGACVGISLAAAQLLGLEKAYWAPVSCLAVIQGASVRAVWSKQMHRILGTVVGLALAWGMLSAPLNAWSIAISMMVLTFIIETAVVRHYASAVIFITPLTILLADSGTLGHGSVAALMQARFGDTCLGSFVGLLGAVCLHNPGFRRIFGGALRRLIPSRFKSADSHI